LKDHDEEMAFVSFYNCSESIRFLQAHEKYNSRTHDEAINKEWLKLKLLFINRVEKLVCRKILN